MRTERTSVGSPSRGHSEAADRLTYIGHATTLIELLEYARLAGELVPGTTVQVLAPGSDLELPDVEA